jgi:hypothetical protein
MGFRIGIRGFVAPSRPPVPKPIPAKIVKDPRGPFRIPAKPGFPHCGMALAGIGVGGSSGSSNSNLPTYQLTHSPNPPGPPLLPPKGSQGLNPCRANPCPNGQCPCSARRRSVSSASSVVRVRLVRSPDHPIARSPDSLRPSSIAKDLAKQSQHLGMVYQTVTSRSQYVVVALLIKCQKPPPGRRIRASANY